MDILSTKRDEIKVQLLKRQLLKPIQKRSYTLTRFAGRSLEALMRDDEAAVVKKELLRIAAETGFVITVASAVENSGSKAFADFAMAFEKLDPIEAGKKAQDQTKQGKQQNSRVETSGCVQLLGKCVKKSNITVKWQEFQLQHVLLDLVLTAAMEAEGLHDDLKFFDDYFDADMSQQLNRYLLLVDLASNDGFNTAASALKNEVRLLLESGAKARYWLSRFDINNDPGTAVMTPANAKTHLTNIGTALQAAKSTSELQHLPTAALTRLAALAARPYSEEEADDMLYEIDELLLPALSAANVQEGAAFEAIVGQLTAYKTDLEGLLSGKVLRDAKSTTWRPVLSFLGSLDQAASYEALIGVVASAGFLFENEVARVAFAGIASGLEKYTVFDAERKELQIDVEGLAVQLFQRFGDRAGRIFGGYFGVGVNYLSARDFIQLDDGSTATGLAYVGEKIGLKVKLCDFQHRYTYRKHPYKAAHLSAPTISDIHAIAYGSGFLYQVNWLRSEAGFQSPLLGAAIGLTFFNGVDAHVGYAVPADQRTFMDGHWSFSMDVRFSDYLSRLNKRKKNSSKSGS